MESVKFNRRGDQYLRIELNPSEPEMSFRGVLGLGQKRSVANFTIQNGIVTIEQKADGATPSIMQIPFKLFYGIAIKQEASFEDGEECVSLYLIMDNDELAVPVFHGLNTEQLLPLWYEWQDLYGLELMIVQSEGVVKSLVQPHNCLHANMPAPRRILKNVKSRRLRMTRRDNFRRETFTHKKNEVISFR